MATRGRRFTIGQLVTLAWRTASLTGVDVEVTAAQGAWTRDLLDLALAELATEGINCAAVELYNLPLISDVVVYDLPAYTFSVVDSGMWIPVGQPVSLSMVEIPVRPVSREMWHEVSAKAAEGPPRIFWTERAAESVRVHLWPKPGLGEDKSTIRFQLHTMAPDSTDAAKNVALENFWNSYLVHRLAKDVALGQSMPLARVQYLGEEADKKLERAKGYAKQGVSQQIINMHSTPWS